MSEKIQKKDKFMANCWKFFKDTSVKLNEEIERVDPDFSTLIKTIKINEKPQYHIVVPNNERKGITTAPYISWALKRPKKGTGRELLAEPCIHIYLTSKNRNVIFSTLNFYDGQELSLIKDDKIICLKFPLGKVKLDKIEALDTELQDWFIKNTITILQNNAVRKEYKISPIKNVEEYINQSEINIYRNNEEKLPISTKFSAETLNKLKLNSIKTQIKPDENQEKYEKESEIEHQEEINSIIIKKESITLSYQPEPKPEQIVSANGNKY